MNCPKCGGNMRVINARTLSPTQRRRRRECDNCGYRQTYYEKIDEIRPTDAPGTFLRSIPALEKKRKGCEYCNDTIRRTGVIKCPHEECPY